ncbi:hypothetical protein COV22_01775 [Candidatus Woesearchaeota archaeon CG10_big_fil_rev_8_21_14_0_10_47_5]|nr:MAG: hypothetical protein COV22_01775 [Candidatus Woesearchaeota archaeon CG10_big_fil_rev_8_21_14_0_10_47_5]
MNQIINGMIIRAEGYIRAQYPKYLFAAIMVIAGFFIIRLVNNALARLFDRTEFDPTLEIFTQKAVGFVLLVTLVLVVLGNLGVNVSAFIAGLGIAGFIIGFATRDVLSNLAAGIFLLIIKPFKVGDIVETAGIKGRVKEISIATCRIISEEGEYIIVPNSKVWGAPIKNLSRLKRKKPLQGA